MKFHDVGVALGAVRLRWSLPGLVVVAVADACAGIHQVHRRLLSLLHRDVVLGRDIP